MSCPNITSPKWKALVNKIGENNAWREFITYGEIPDVSNYNDVENNLQNEYRSIRTRSTEDIAKGINRDLIKTKKELKYTQHITSNILSYVGDLDPNRKLDVTPEQAFNKAKNTYLKITENLKDVVSSGLIVSNKDYETLKKDVDFPKILEQFPILQYINSYDDLIGAFETYDDITKNFDRYKDYVIAELGRKGIKIKKDRIDNNDKDEVANQIDDENISNDDEIASVEQGESFGKSAFEINTRNTASIRVKGFVQSIKVPNKYELGMPIYADPNDVFADILYAGASMNLSAYTDVETKYTAFKSKLVELVEGRPYILGLIQQLDGEIKNNKWEKVNDVLTFASKAFAQETLLTYETVKQGDEIKGIKNVKVFDSNRDTVKDQVSRSWINQHVQSKFFDKNSLGELKPNEEKLNKLNEIIESGRTGSNSIQDLNKKFAEFFEVLGIKLTLKDMEYISPKIAKALDRGETIRSAFGKNAILENIYNEYLKNKNIVFENNYGLTNEKSSMNELAKLYYEANPGMFIIASSKSADGKSKYLYIQPSFVEIKKREFENGNRNYLLNSALAKPATKFWNNVINKVSVFKLQYFNGIKEKTRDGKVRKHLTDKEQIVTMLLKHQADLNTGTYINFTLSDKTTTIESKITKEFFVNSDASPLGEKFDFNAKSGKIEYTAPFKKKLYNTFAAPEISRILNAVKYQNNVNIENFDISSKLFYIIPSLNTDKSLENFRIDLYSGKMSLEQIEEKYGDVIAQAVLNDFTKSTEETIDDLTNQGIIKITKKNGKDAYSFPLNITGNKKSDYSQRLNNTGLNGRDKAILMVMDMKVNYMNAQVKMIQYLRFDPYLAFKGKVEEGSDIYSISADDKIKMVNATWDEFSKRAAALIAPGAQGNFKWTKSDGTVYNVPEYNSVTVEDVEYKINGLKNTIADGQEFVTMSEHIDVLHSESKIPTSIWQSIYDKIQKAGKGGYYKLSDEELKYVFNPTKPVHVNDVNEGDTTGLNRIDYIKSSRYPLIPEHETGSQRDELRKWMEKNDIRSAAFKSGKKLGRPSKSIRLFEQDGTFVEPTQNDILSSIQVLSRDGLKTQQEIPHQKEEITNVSQLNRRIFDEMLDETFSIKGLKNITGYDAKSIKEEVRSQQFERAAQKLRDELGDLNVSHRNLQRKLIETIKNDTTGSYGENDIRALALGKDGKFGFDFEFQFKSEKYQGLINSMINHNVQLKTKGSSFIQVSAIGSKFNFSSLSKGVQSGIIWTKEFASTFKDDEQIGLNYIKKDDKNVVKPAQVIVSQYIKDDKGNLINLEEFITTNEKGVKILDTSKFSKELFQLIATRIPNQGLISTLPVEVVGFLPSYMENTIIVPDGITGQMGSDFDVDKLYAYISNSKSLYNKENKVIGVDALEYDLNNISDIKNLSDEQLEQLYYDLHWMVLTHPAAYDKITKSVDMPEPGKKIELRKELLEKYNIVENEKTNLPLDFMKSISRYNDNRSGKTGVSVFASLGSAYADFQNKVIRLGFKDNNKKIPTSIKIKESKNSKVIELKNIGKLASAKSFVKENGKNVIRTITDSINIMFTESVDNAKNQLLNAFNWNDQALSSIGVFQLLSSDKNECVPIEFIMDLTSQNIISSLFKKIDAKKDSFGEFDPMAINSAASELITIIEKEINEKKYLSTGQTALDYLLDQNRDDVLDGETLKNMWAVGKALAMKDAVLKEEVLQKLTNDFNYKSKNDLLLDYYTTQYDALNLFVEMDKNAREFMTIVGVIYPYAKGIGSNVFHTKQRLFQLNKLNFSNSFIDIENIAGEITKNDNTGDMYIVPTGEIGSGILNSYIFAQDEIYSKLFPLSSGRTIENIVNKLVGSLGKTKDELGKQSYVNVFSTVFKAMKSYLFTAPSLELFDTDLSIERKRLITDENPLAERITNLTNEDENLLTNGFLKNLEIKKQWKSNIYDINFRAPLGDELDEKAILSGFYELVVHPNEKVRQVAKDLAIYPFLTGDAGMIGRFIPVDYYMSDKDFSNNISKLKSLLVNDDKKTNALITQIVQNNPEEYSKNYVFSSTESQESSGFVNNKFKNAFTSAILNTNSLEKVNKFTFKYSDLLNFDKTNNTKFAKSFQVPLTTDDKNIIQSGSDGSLKEYSNEDYKYPDYITIKEVVSYIEEDSKEILYLYKRVSPLATEKGDATYEKIPILGHGNIKEYSYFDDNVKSIIKNNNVLEIEEEAPLEPGMPVAPFIVSTEAINTPVANIPQNKVSGIDSFGSKVIANDQVIKALGPNPHSIDMIEAGFRTRTTRSEKEMAKYAIKVGDIIKHFGKSADDTTKNILARVTAIHPKGTPGFKGTWDKEGWRLKDVNVIDKFKDGAAAIEFEVITPTQTTSEQNTNNPANYTNHSGGAKGYDAEWDLVGAEFGMVNNKHYLLPSDGAVSDPRLQAKGVKPVDATNDVGPVALQGPAIGEAQIAVTNAERAMGRIEPNHTTRNTKKIRNYAQVKNADAIFAIGSLIPKGADITVARGQATKKALVPQVNGGTSVAVQLGITMGKPTYVFNQVANNTYSQGWYKWDNAKQDFVSVNTPVLTKNFAGIGTSSNTTEAGKQAIKDVYTQTFSEENTSAQPVSNEKINIYAGTRENAELSNFAARPFNYNGQNFSSVEQAFQYAKGEFYNIYEIDPSSNETPNDLRAKVDAHLANILKSKTGAEVKALGKKNIGVTFENNIWDSESSRIMKDLLKASFEQNPEALKTLLATGTAELTHTQDKTKWAKEFPKILMEVREELKLISSQKESEEKDVNQESSTSFTDLSYKNREFLYEDDYKKYYYKKQDGSQGAEVVDQGLKDKLNLVRNTLLYPQAIASIKVGPNDLSYFVTGDNKVISLQESTYGDVITDKNVILKVLLQHHNQSVVQSKDEIIESNQSSVSTTKEIVVPEGSNPNNNVIFETKDKIFLMNDGQQQAFTFIKDKVTQLLANRQEIFKEDLDSTIVFDDPLSKKFSGIIPAEMWNNMIGLAGRGGVGKTTVINAILDAIKNTGNKYNRVTNYYLTPSHVASTVLQESLGLDSEKANDGTVFTIASMVRSMPGESGNFKLTSEEDYLKSLKYKKAVGQADIIIIDESSMVTSGNIKDIVTRLKTDLENKVISKMPIFIFMGDYRQLGPINEQQNPLVNKGIISSTLLLNSNKTKELTQVMRSDNKMLHEIFDSVGNQIIINIDKTQNEEEPIRLSLKEFDRLTNQSTKDMLVVDSEDGVIDDYTTYLSQNNNPSGMFWVHYNNVNNAKTKNMSKKIRKNYFEKIGQKIEEKQHREYTINDYVLFNGGMEVKSHIIPDYVPTNNKIKEVLDKTKTFSKNVKGIETFSITQSYFKPQSRYKVIDVYEKERSLDYIFNDMPDLKRILSKTIDLENTYVNTESTIFYTRQNTIRGFVNPIGMTITLGNYSKLSKKQEGLKIIDTSTKEVIAKFDLPYGIFKDNEASLKSFSNYKSEFVNSYIGSSHTAQGNSIKNPIVGEANIRETLANPVVNQDDAFSSLYVALTRTSGTLTILKRNNAKIHHNEEVYLGPVKDDGSRSFEENPNISKERLPDFENVEEEIITSNYNTFTDFNNFEDLTDEFYDDEGVYTISPEDSDNFNSFDLLFESEYPEFIGKLKNEIISDGSNKSDNKTSILNAIYKKGNDFNKSLMSALSVSKIVKPFTLVFDNNAADPGHYNNETKVITINPQLAVGQGTISEAEGRNRLHKIFMHELLHHVLVDLLNANPNSLSPAQKVHVQALKNLFEQVKEKMQNDPVHAEPLKKAMDSLKSEGFLSQKEKTLYYGLTSVHEFASMLIEDEGFREFMNNTEYSGTKTIVQRFIEIMSNILKSLGIVVKNDSVLKEGLSSILGIIENSNIETEQEFKSVKTNVEQYDYLMHNFDKIINILNIKIEC